ncbi:MAG: caspase family protein [Nitrospira sp.]|nr:caspase family protein [Nitrospira sp.]
MVIGIDEYRDPQIPKLKYAVADARAIGEELERRGYEVKLLLNGEATERAINTELRTKLRQRTGKDDRVVVYYAGHGQDDKVEDSRTMGYLLPVDGELENIPGTGISMGVVKELADALSAKHVLFLVDACYGGVAGQQTRALPRTSEAYVKQITRERGRQLITAGGADQEALEASEGGHGLFTAFLLKGLTEGLADLNDDGIIPASELYTYLDSRVFSEAQMRGHQQRPEIWTLSSEKGEFVFFATAHGRPTVDQSGVQSPTPEAYAPSVDRPRRRFDSLSSSVNDALSPSSQDVARLPPQRTPGSADIPGRREQELIVVNDVVLDEGWIEAFREAGLQSLTGGRYWFDEISGLWGREGEPPSGKSSLKKYDRFGRVSSEKLLGFIKKKETFPGNLKADASRGATRVFINGRELPEIEVQEMRVYLPTLSSGRYRLDREGYFGPEGQELNTVTAMNLNRLKEAQLSGGSIQTRPYPAFPSPYRTYPHPYGR